MNIERLVDLFASLCDCLVCSAHIVSMVSRDAPNGPTGVGTWVDHPSTRRANNVCLFLCLVNRSTQEANRCKRPQILFLFMIGTVQSVRPVPVNQECRLLACSRGQTRKQPPVSEFFIWRQYLGEPLHLGALNTGLSTCCWYWYPYCHAH